MPPQAHGREKTKRKDEKLTITKNIKIAIGRVFSSY